MRQGRWPRFFRRLLLLTAIFACLAAGCQRQAEKHRIGILGVSSFSAAVDGFKSTVAEMGYGEGRNVEYDTYILVSTTQDEDMGVIRSILDKYIAAKVSLIFVMGTPLTITAKEMTQNTGIPVVFANALVEGENIISSVSRPGGNMTGVRFPGTDLAVKRLELLGRIVPTAKRVYVTYDPKNASAAAAITALRPTAGALGMTLVESRIRGVADIKADLKARENARDVGFDAILIMPEGFSQSPEGWGAIAAFAQARGIPVVGSAAFEAEEGAVLTLIPDDREIGQLAAKLAVKIFQGFPAGSLPVVSPESRLRLNLSRAQKLGIRIDDGLLKMADEIIR